MDDARPRSERIAVAALFAAGSLASVFAQWVRRFSPAVDDEHAYLLQAKTFALGRLFLPAPRLPEFFEAPHVLVAPHYLSKYFPGHALLLAPFAALDVAWLWPCVCLGLATALVYRLARGAGLGLGPALLASGCLLASPHDLLGFSTLLSHSTCALFALLCLRAAQRWEETGAERHALAMGAAAGVAFLARPYTGLALAVALGLALLRRRPAVRPLFAAAAPLLAAALCLALYDRATVGTWTQTPWELWAQQYTPGDGPGFARAAYASPLRAVPPQLQPMARRFRKQLEAYTPAALPGAAAARLVELGEFFPAPLFAALALFGVACALRRRALLVPLAYAAALFALQLRFHTSVLQYQVELYPVAALAAALGLHELLRALREAHAPRACLALHLGVLAAALGALAVYGPLFGTQAAPAAVLIPGALLLAALLALRSGRAGRAGRPALAAALLLSLAQAVATVAPRLALLAHEGALPCPAPPAGTRACKLAAFAEVRRAIARQHGLLFVRYEPGYDYEELIYPVIDPGLGVRDPDAIVAVDRGADDGALLAEYPARPAFVLEVDRWLLRPLR